MGICNTKSEKNTSADLNTSLPKAAAANRPLSVATPLPAAAASYVVTPAPMSLNHKETINNGTVQGNTSFAVVDRKETNSAFQMSNKKSDMENELRAICSDFQSCPTPQQPFNGREDSNSEFRTGGQIPVNGYNHRDPTSEYNTNRSSGDLTKGGNRDQVHSNFGPNPHSNSSNGKSQSDHYISSDYYASGSNG